MKNLSHLIIFSHPCQLPAFIDSSATSDTRYVWISPRTSHFPVCPKCHLQAYPNHGTMLVWLRGCLSSYMLILLGSVSWIWICFESQVTRDSISNASPIASSIFPCWGTTGRDEMWLGQLVYLELLYNRFGFLKQHSRTLPTSNRPAVLSRWSVQYKTRIIWIWDFFFFFLIPNVKSSQWKYKQTPAP